MSGSKRELLKVLSVAGAAATLAVWKKPVVNTITIPAHARGSLRCPEQSDCETIGLCGPGDDFEACMNSYGLSVDVSCPRFPC